MKIQDLNKKIKEEAVAKLGRIVPGVEAEVDMGNGTKTVIDLKKNPQALVKSPDGKIMMNTAGITSGGVQPQAANPTNIMKTGEPVFSTATNNTPMEDDEPKHKTIRGPHGRLDIDRSKKGVTRVTRRGYRNDEPERDKQIGRRRPVGSTGFTPGVGVAQKNSFSDVPTERGARRQNPRLDRDDEITEVDQDRRNFLKKAAAVGAVAAGAGLGHVYTMNQLRKNHQELLQQADFFADRGEAALHERDLTTACRYFDRSADAYEQAGMANYAEPMRALADTCRKKARDI